MVILGAGESGVGAAILAQTKGYTVFVSDMGRIKDNYKVMLDEHGIRWEEGQHTASEILDADEVVKSPGIPDTAPMVRSLREQGTPILSEIEFAGRYTKARTICVTGSNGKTTTTSLIYYILEKAGYDVGLAGNIGKSFALQVATADRAWYVIELSSFQLDGMYDFRADIAVLLNITPDHLDRYDYCMQRYVDSKMRIVQNQRPEDYFIYWQGDDYAARELALRLSGEKTPTAVTPIAFADDSPLPVAREALSIPGLHNVRNCLAAYHAARAAGIGEEVIAACLQSFPGVAHRLERVTTKSGVHFVNDSKATNVDACYVALQAMTTPTVLIVGGTDKGNDYSVLLPLIQEKCRALVYLGADNAKLHAAFDDLGLPVADTHAMADCVAACVRLAKAGDTVLLSPCCASFDLFCGMADRGNQFKACVAAL